MDIFRGPPFLEAQSAFIPHCLEQHACPRRMAIQKAESQSVSALDVLTWECKGTLSRALVHILRVVAARHDLDQSTLTHAHHLEQQEHPRIMRIQKAESQSVPALESLTWESKETLTWTLCHIC